jgi:DNA modification methylase
VTTPSPAPQRIADDLAELATPLDRLDLLDGNPRRGDVDAVAASYDQFGQRKPIVARRLADGRGEVIAGNTQLAAARKLGWDAIAVVWVDDDDLTSRAFALADNHTAELGGYDTAALAEMVGLVASDPALLAATAYTTGDLAELVARARRGSGDVDALPDGDGVEPVAQLGDRWRLGDHRLICGDARDRTVIAALLDGDEPELMVTDPPYGVELDPRWRDGIFQPVGSGEKPYMMAPDGSSRDIITDWSPVYELVPSLRVAYVWFASNKALSVLDGLRRLGFELGYLIIWDKTRPTIGRGSAWYYWAHEPCAVVRRGKAPFVGTHGMPTIWRAPSPKQHGVSAPEEQDEKWGHPAQKPLAVIEPPILNHLRGGGLVFDPFLGSGTTLIAAEVHGRRCVGVEVEPRYVDLIVRRWETLTGATAVREPGAVSPVEVSQTAE